MILALKKLSSLISFYKNIDVKGSVFGKETIIDVDTKCQIYCDRFLCCKMCLHKD